MYTVIDRQRNSQDCPLAHDVFLLYRLARTSKIISSSGAWEEHRFQEGHYDIIHDIHELRINTDVIGSDLTIVC